jgi:hypothetical protein
MIKFLLALSIVFMSTITMVHSIFVYQYNAVQTLVAEEEPHEDKPNKKVFDNKDKSLLSLKLSLVSSLYASLLSLNESLKLPKGFVEKPYLPPDVI